MNKLNLHRMIFTQQRTIILCNSIKRVKFGFSDSYVFAWKHSIYPYLHDKDEDTSTHHDGFADSFRICKTDVREVLEYIDLKESEKIYLKFNEIRKKFPRIPLVDTLVILRYAFLYGFMDDSDVWKAFKGEDLSNTGVLRITKDIKDFEISLE